MTIFFVIIFIIVLRSKAAKHFGRYGLPFDRYLLANVLFFSRVVSLRSCLFFVFIFVIVDVDLVRINDTIFLCTATLRFSAHEHYVSTTGTDGSNGTGCRFRGFDLQRTHCIFRWFTAGNGGVDQGRRHHVDLGVVRCLYRAFDTQHLSHRVLVTVADFELFPRLPEVGRYARIAHLAAVRVDRSGTIDFAELGFHLGKQHAHLARIALR
uniref:Putative secreted protein n=1 Tax=Anopheles marajoara TaxID=58244 RepID=A0A2M4C6R6_9DIPT